MEITRDTIKYVAHLARIELSPAETERLAGQLEDILRFIGKLKKLNIENTGPASHILPLHNVFREDTLQTSLSTGQALKNAPSQLNDFFVVPRIIE